MYRYRNMLFSRIFEIVFLMFDKIEILLIYCDLEAYVIKFLLKKKSFEFIIKS